MVILCCTVKKLASAAQMLFVKTGAYFVDDYVMWTVHDVPDPFCRINKCCYTVADYC
jgi:hypothetical protein